MLGRWQLHQIAKTLMRGGVIAYPTESVFGLGCDPTNMEAIDTILSIKNRPAKKGLILLISDISQATPFIQPLSEAELSRMSVSHSRATTWLLPKSQTASEMICGQNDTIAVRLTQHPIAKQICSYTNSALISTSCNLAGKPELTRVTHVRNQMKTQLNWVVNGVCGGQKPSRIIDLMNDHVVRS